MANLTKAGAAAAVGVVATSAAGWVFPHSTCESPLALGGADVGVHLQPWSMLLNLANTALLASSVVGAPSAASGRAMASYVLFEAIHTLSHIVHLNRHMHEIAIHACGYLIAWTTCACIRAHIRDHKLSAFACALICLSILADLCLFTTKRGLYSVASGLGVMATCIACYLHKLPRALAAETLFLIFGSGMLAALFVIEAAVCESFLRSKIPFHPIIEIWGLVLFQTLSKLMCGVATSSKLGKQKNL